MKDWRADEQFSKESVGCFEIRESSDEGANCGRLETYSDYKRYAQWFYSAH